MIMIIFKMIIFKIFMIIITTNFREAISCVCERRGVDVEAIVVFLEQNKVIKELFVWMTMIIILFYHYPEQNLIKEWIV